MDVSLRVSLPAALSAFASAARCVQQNDKVASTAIGCTVHKDRRARAQCMRRWHGRTCLKNALDSLVASAREPVSRKK